MFEPFIYGISTGAVMSVMLGTVFFALIQNSIDNGFRSGMLISLGVILSDIILITLAMVFSASALPEGGVTEMLIRIAGAIFLLAYGVSNLTRKKKIAYPESKRGRILVFLITGFLLNILNPGNFIGWAAVSTNLVQVVGYSTQQCLYFFAGALSAIFCTETVIALLAVKLKRYVSDKFLRYIDVTVGVLFIGFAGFLLLPLGILTIHLSVHH